MMIVWLSCDGQTIVVMAERLLCDGHKVVM